MMSKGEKLGKTVLMVGMGPKGSSGDEDYDEEEYDEESDYEMAMEETSDKLFDAIKADDREAFREGLMSYWQMTRM